MSIINFIILICLNIDIIVLFYFSVKIKRTHEKTQTIVYELSDLYQHAPRYIQREPLLSFTDYETIYNAMVEVQKLKVEDEIKEKVISKLNEQIEKSTAEKEQTENIINNILNNL